MPITLPYITLCPRNVAIAVPSSTVKLGKLNEVGCLYVRSVCLQRNKVLDGFPRNLIDIYHEDVLSASFKLNESLR